MTALSITATDVVAAAGASTGVGVLGGTVTAGQPLYQDTDGTYKLADSNDTAAKAKATAIALQGGASGQTIAIFKGGGINLGATLAIGETYCLGTTAGEIVPIGDLATDDFVTILGVATSASNLNALFYASGAQHYSTA